MYVCILYAFFDNSKNHLKQACRLNFFFKKNGDNIMSKYKQMTINNIKRGQEHDMILD